jgi:hypothetical protein
MKQLSFFHLKSSSIKIFCLSVLFVVLIAMQGLAGSITWKGADNNGNGNEWNRKNNWTPEKIPTSTDDVVIPSVTHGKYPVITTNAVCKSITINSGASLTVNSVGNLAISGSWTNDGTFTQNSGTVTFTGDNNAEIKGEANTTFTSLKVNKGNGRSAEVHLNGKGKVEVNNSLSIDNGLLKINSGGALNLSGTAAAPSSGIAVNGGTYTLNGGGITTKSIITSTTSGGNWNNKNIWVGTKVPATTDDVVIDGPVIINNPETCNSLTINVGKTLTANNSFTVSGNWTNNGTFTANGQTVTFNGTSQSIGGTSTTTFGILTITTGSTVTGTTAPNATTFNINGGGKYIQTTGYTVPGTTKNFASTSTYEWQTGGGGTFPSAAGITFGNLTINSLSGNNTAGGNLTTVNGNLYIQNTTNGSYRLAANTASTTTIAGSLILDAGLLNFSTGSANQIINVNGNVQINGGTLQPMSGTGIPSINVSGNWTSNGGTFIPGTSTVTFNGTSAQTITGATTFYNLITSNSGKKTIAAGTAITVSHDLTTTGSTLEINSASASSNGSLIVYGTSTGNVTYNRYMAPTRWYIASAPVNVITGFSVASNKDKINISSGEYDLAPYQENYVSATNTDGWKYYKSSPDEFPGSLTPGIGYLISLNKPSTYGTGIIQFKGDLNNGSVTPILSSHANYGWNAVGNPYTSAIKITGTGTGTDNFLDVNLVAGNLEEAYAAIYVWNEDVTGYDETQQFYKAIGNSGYTYTPPPGTYNGSAISGPYVQAGQGFLVKLKTDKTSVSFTKDMQVSQPTISLKSAETSWPGITLLAESNGQTRSTVVAFNEAMTTGLDVTYDAGLLASDDFQVYTHLVSNNNPVDFAIQCLPDHQYSQLRVPVGIDLPDGGELVFKASGIILPDGIYPIIEDKLLGTQTALKTETDSYKVTLDKNTTGIGRFYLSMGGDMALSVIKPQAETKYTASFMNDRIVLNGAVEPGTKASLFDICGRKLADYQLENTNRNEIPVSGLNQKVYLLKIEGKNTRQMIKLLAIKY